MTGRRSRPKQVKFWTNEEELMELKERVYKSKLTQNEYLLRCSLNKNIIVIDGLKELLIELSNTGNVLNEIKEKNIVDNEEFIEIKSKLFSVWDKIEEALDYNN